MKSLKWWQLNDYKAVKEKKIGGRKNNEILPAIRIGRQIFFVCLFVCINGFNDF